MRTMRLAALACMLVASQAIDTAKAEPVKIRVDWSTIPGQFAPLIPTVPKYAPNVYRHYGKSYVVEPLRMQGGGASLTALAAGQVDIATSARKRWSSASPRPSSKCG